MAVRSKVMDTEVKSTERVVPVELAQPKKSMAEKMFPLMVVALVVGAFAMGSMWSKMKYLETAKSEAATKTADTTVQAQQQVQPKADINTIKALFNQDLIKFGNGNSKLLLVEVADPSCPYCHVAAGRNPELNAQVGTQFKLVSQGGSYVSPVVEMKKLVDSGKASYVYIYSNGHGNGEVAQRALYCANEKGKFWEVSDKLMTNAGYNLINNEIKNDKANTGKLVNFLKGVVDANFLKSCIESTKYDQRLASDQQLAASIGVQGTPGFFVNDTMFPGAYSWTNMKSVADAALK